MKITFITHSCFFLESETCYLLFDYFKGDLPVVKNDKPLFSFSSHSHDDHFSPAVFELANEFTDSYFIISDDISKKCVPSQFSASTIFVTANEEHDWFGMKIKTLKSTDKGVAFALQVDGKEIYHAGDLNDWSWNESTPSENTEMRTAYLNELRKIADKNFFVAFVPLDSRQEEYFEFGMLGFFQNCNAQSVFPMHMWNDFSPIKLFTEKHPTLTQKIINISSEYQSFEI